MTATRSPASLDAPTAVRRRRWTPDGLVAGACAAAALVASAWRGLLDIDLFWHVIVGREILDGVPVADAGRGWSIAPVPDTWVSTQWLSEVLLAWLERLGGWTAVLWWRYAMVAAVLLVLGLAVLRGRSVRAGAVPFAIGACAVAGFAQERSSLWTAVLAPVVGVLAWRALLTGRLPRWWAVLPVVVVWANLHGGWVVAVGAAGLVWLARMLDHGWRDRAAWGSLGIAALVAAGACVSPLGPANLLSALRFSSAASTLVVEWAPTQPLAVADGGLLWTAPAAAFALVWAFGRRRPTRGEVLVVLALLAFGLLAWRNVPVMGWVLAAPLAATLAAAWPSASVAAQGGPTSWRTLLPLDRAGLLLAAVTALAMLPVVGRHGELPAAQPVALARLLAERPGPVRVLDDYNTSGILLLCGGGPGHVLVAVDGRTERHGAEYLRRYRDLMNTAPGWETTLEELRPDVAVLANTVPLASALLTRKGWHQVASTPAGYLLLEAPTPGKADVDPVQPAARTDASCTAPAATASRAPSPAAEAAPTTSAHTSARRSSTRPASARADDAPVRGAGGS